LDKLDIKELLKIDSIKFRNSIDEDSNEDIIELIMKYKFLIQSRSRFLKPCSGFRNENLLSKLKNLV
jgi:hypothetical protein